LEKILSKKSVLVVGTGTIGEPLVGLLATLRKRLGIENVYFHKRTPLIDEVGKVNSMCRKGAKLVATDLACAEKFNVYGNHAKDLLDSVFNKVDVVIDCTPAGNQNKDENYLGLDAAYSGRILFVAQGSEKGFGVPYAYGINDDILGDPHFMSTRFVQVVSCNTHNIACLLATLGSFGKVVESDFVCIRRANDVSQDGSFVASPTLGSHSDKKFGTHHARDVNDLMQTVKKSVPVYSSAMKTNSQYMHTIRFSITVDKAMSHEDVVGMLRENKFIALTHKACSNKVFSFGRDHGYYGRIYNQAVVSVPSLQVRKTKNNKTAVTGFCFTPQDGNSLLSSAVTALYGIHGDDYKQYLHVLDELLFEQV